ncbi:M10 family metallopeptidase domain-containing protein [Corallococcus llansteffanensis]|uniref:M10 family metallopeptidase domain-containing protein n=1 Tax=Corallococcus llansteffanensis TaxID=2316731 RepID=UPI001FC93A78|nr:M10 family metallopeptidase domain-containing protein [Corallococcus llansteffanensis]
MTTVMLCGALVSGCQGEDWESSSHEQPGGNGTEASVASTRQAIVSPELAASLACAETYATAGTCDWAHWSELVETCLTYAHPELEDGVFIDAVQSGQCTAANWSVLREQLLAPRPPSVFVRESCNGGSQVIQEAASSGCYTLAPTAGASFVDVPVGKTVTLHAAGDCTGDSVTVETDTNLCETSFGSGASANDKVRSFRVQDVEVLPSSHRYDCASGESTCVENHNNASRLAAINKKLTVKIVRMTLDGKTTPALTTIKNTVSNLSDYYAVASRNQLSLEVIASQNVVVTSTNCATAKTQARQKATSSSAFLTVYVLPGGVCSTSNAGSRSVNLKGTLFRDYAHEVGHVLGLAHGNVRDPSTGTVKSSGDSSTYMGIFASDNYNLPQLHWLGWTKKEEIVKINSAIASNGFTEITLRPVGSNADSTNPLPMGAVWEIPGTDQRLFIAVPKPRLTGTNQIEGGTVFAYRAPKCVGCTGMAMGTMQMARFGAKSINEHEASGIFITPVGYTSSFVQVDGQSVEVFTSVTLRVRQ